MSYKDKKEMLKFAILLNLVIGIYNLYLFAFSNSIFNLVIGALNVGVWVFFRDMKLISLIQRNKHHH